jgi:hypothetical protein
VSLNTLAFADDQRQALLDRTDPNHSSAFSHYLKQDVDLVGEDLLAFLRLPGSSWSLRRELIDHLAPMQRADLVEARNALYLELGDPTQIDFDSMVAGHALIFLISKETTVKAQAQQLVGAIIDRDDIPDYQKTYLLNYGFDQTSPDTLHSYLQNESGELGWQYILSGRGALEVLVRYQYKSKQAAIDGLRAYRKLEYPHLEPQGDLIPEKPTGLFIDGLIQEVEAAERPRQVADRYLQVLKIAAMKLSIKKCIAEEIIERGGSLAFVEDLKKALLELDPATDDLPDGWPRWDIYADFNGHMDRGITYVARFSNEIYSTLLHALALSLAKVLPSDAAAHEEAALVLTKGTLRTFAYLGIAGSNSMSVESSEQNGATVFARNLGDAIRNVRILPDQTLSWLMDQAARNEPTTIFQAGLEGIALDFPESVSLEALTKETEGFISWLKRVGKGCHSAETSVKWAASLVENGGITANQNLIEARLRDLRQRTCIGEGVNHLTAIFMVAADLVPAKGTAHSFGYRANLAYYERGREFILEESIVGDIESIRVGVRRSRLNDSDKRITLATGDRFARSLFVTSAPYFDGHLLTRDQLDEAGLTWLSNRSTSRLPDGCFERILDERTLPKQPLVSSSGDPCAHGRWEKEFEMKRRQSLLQVEEDPRRVHQSRKEVVQRYLKEIVDLFGDDGFIMKQVIQFETELRYAREYATTMGQVTAGADDVANEALSKNSERIARLEKHLRELDQAMMKSIEIAEDQTSGGGYSGSVRYLALTLWNQSILPSATLLDYLKRSVYFGDDFSTENYDETKAIVVRVLGNLLSIPLQERSVGRLYDIAGPYLHDVLNDRLSSIMDDVVVAGFESLNEADSYKSLTAFVGEVDRLPETLKNDPNVFGLTGHIGGFRQKYANQVERDGSFRFWLKWGAIGIGIVASIVTFGAATPLLAVAISVGIGVGTAYAANIPDNNEQERIKEIERIETQTRINTDDLAGKEGAEALPWQYDSALSDAQQLYYCTPTQLYITNRNCNEVIARNNRMVMWAGIAGVTAAFTVFRVAQAVRISRTMAQAYRAGRMAKTAAELYRVSRTYRVVQLASRHKILAALLTPVAVAGQIEMTLQLIESWPQLRDDVLGWHSQRLERRQRVRVPHHLQFDSDEARVVNLVYASKMLGVPLETLLEEQKIAMRSETVGRIEHQYGMGK